MSQGENPDGGGPLLKPPDRQEFNFELECFDPGTGHFHHKTRFQHNCTVRLRTQFGTNIPDMNEVVDYVRRTRGWAGAMIVRYCHPAAVPVIILPKSLEGNHD